LKIPVLILAAAAAASLAAAPPPKRQAGNIAFPPAPYPEEARKKGIEGNVVLTGDISADGKVSNLKILASSSVVLEAPALAHIRASKFPPGKEDGKAVPLVLNATVRFRDDRNRLADTGSMPAPIVGDFSVMPASGDGRPSGPEGFAIEPGDAGIRGQLVIDVPKASAGRTFHFTVTARFPGGKSVVVLDRTESSDPRAGLGADVFRSIDASRREEQGVHTLTVTVDGKNAGGARYRVGGPASPAPVKTRKK
jgi:TonB family protein